MDTQTRTILTLPGIRPLWEVRVSPHLPRLAPFDESTKQTTGAIVSLVFMGFTVGLIFFHVAIYIYGERAIEGVGQTVRFDSTYMIQDRLQYAPASVPVYC